MTIIEGVEINPKIMMEKPVIRGTRIPVEILLRKLSEGATEADLLKACPKLTTRTFKPPSAMQWILWFMKKSFL